MLPHTFPGIPSNNEVQIEGIAYIFCGLWISSVLACLCVTSQLNSTAPGSIPGVGYANNPKRLLMAMVPRRPTTSTSPTRPRRPMMPGSQQRQGGQPGALGPGLPALRILPWFDSRCWLRRRPPCQGGQRRQQRRGPWLRLACTEDNPAVHPSIHYPLYAWQLSAPLHLAQAGWPSRPEYGKHMIESTTNS